MTTVTTPAARRRRSVHFVPGGNARYLDRALASAADTLVLDLEDSVPPDRKPAAREVVVEWLTSADVARRAAGKELMVRVNSLDTAWGRDDVSALVERGPRALMVPKVERVADLDAVDQVIAAADLLASITYFPVVTETAAAVVNLPSVAVHHRVDGVCWGAEDLSAALGAASARDLTGRFLPVFETVRSWCLIGAAAAGVPAIDAVFTDLADLDGLRAESELAAAMGFAGKITIHPDQIDIVNAAFTPSPERIADAEALIAEFSHHAAEGRLSFLHNGQMVDAPHLTRARSILARAGITPSGATSPGAAP
ncbi:MAG: HpcH/HpaI aldolase/citrate lyase family protein [Ilumatobacteraceae bacterium]